MDNVCETLEAIQEGLGNDVCHFVKLLTPSRHGIEGMAQLSLRTGERCELIQKLAGRVASLSPNIQTCFINFGEEVYDKSVLDLRYCSSEISYFDKFRKSTE